MQSESGQDSEVKELGGSVSSHHHTIHPDLPHHTIHHHTDDNEEEVEFEWPVLPAQDLEIDDEFLLTNQVISQKQKILNSN